MNDDAAAMLDAANRWIDGATFAGASAEQVTALIEIFETRAGRQLNDLEVSALFELQHGLVGKRAFIEGILTGRIKVVGKRADGAFVYSA
jgi:hypothetical protein